MASKGARGRLHENRFGIDDEAGYRERDAVGNAGFDRVQADDPGLARQKSRQRPFSNQA